MMIGRQNHGFIHGSSSTERAPRYTELLLLLQIFQTLIKLFIDQF
jgi:hypothetical protein